MTLAEVETFLSIVHTKSITKTSELLFLSQPAISHRLRSLEEELGFSLLARSKGHKMVELTPKGEAFVPIAERWSSLWKETMALRDQEDRLLLTIGCTDSLSLSIMAPLYRQLLSSDARIDLSIQTHHSLELYRMLNDHDIDLGFVYHQLHYSSITNRHYCCQSCQEKAEQRYKEERERETSQILETVEEEALIAV